MIVLTLAFRHNVATPFLYRLSLVLRVLFLLILTALPGVSHAVQSKTFPAHTPGSRGTVMVLAPAGTPVDSGVWQRTLLRTLPHHGWQTLSVGDLANVDDLKALQSNPTPHYWVASGQMAGALITNLAQSPQPMPAGLVLLGPYHPDPAENARLAEQLAGLGLPVLDLSGPADHPLARATVAERRQANRRTGNPHYQAIHWALDWDHGSDNLAQRVRGWLKQQRASTP